MHFLEAFFGFCDLQQGFFDGLVDCFHFLDLFLHLSGTQLGTIRHGSELTQHFMVVGQGFLQFIEVFRMGQ
jgi:hypothetical protein